MATGRKVFGWRGHAVRLDTAMNGLAQTPSGDCCDMGRSLCCNGTTRRPRDSHCVRADSVSTAGAGCTDPQIHGSSPG